MLYVSGADLMDGTPIYDIKPYIAYTDSHPDAVSGFASTPAEYLLEVDCPEELLKKVPENQRESLIEVLAHDPRPQYQADPERVYGMAFGSQPITSYNLGAGQPERVHSTLRILLAATLAWSLAVWLVMMIFSAPITGLVLGSGELSAYTAPLVKLSFTAPSAPWVRTYI